MDTGSTLVSSYMGNSVYTTTISFVLKDESFKKKVIGKQCVGEPQALFDEGMMKTKHG